MYNYPVCNIDINNCVGKNIQMEDYNNLLKTYNLDIKYNKVGSLDDSYDMRKILRTLEIIYNMNTYYLAYYFMKYSKLIDFYNKQCRDKKRMDVTLTLFENLDYTQRKNIELNLVEYDKIKNYNYTLKIIVLMIGGLIFIPILLKTKIINKSLSLVIWVFGIIITILVSIFLLFIKKPKEDNTYYEILNQPTNKTYKESDILEMGKSKKNREKCSKWNEIKTEYDISDTNIVEVKKKCDNFKKQIETDGLNNKLDYKLLDECNYNEKCVKESKCTESVICKNLELLKTNLNYDDNKMYNEIKTCDKWDSIKHVFYPTTSICNMTSSSSSS